MQLWDADRWDNNDPPRSYSYYIEVSVDQENWHRIIDYTNFDCRLRQKLNFPAQGVRFIKLVGTHSTDELGFHVAELRALYYTVEQQKEIDEVMSRSYRYRRYYDVPSYRNNARI